MPRIAQIDTTTPTDAARRGSESVTRMAQDAARETLDLARDTVRAAPSAREAMDAAEIGRSLLELTADQTRHNLEAAATFGRSVDWTALITLQRDFMSASVARMTRANDQWRALLQIAGATSGARR